MLRIEALCQKFNLSENYIGRYFKRHFQESLQQYISRNRIKMAESLIKDTQLSMKEIAYRTGYSDACHLTKKFQSYYGISPLKYRKQSVLQKKEQHNSSSDSTLR
jgi:transcriptional regulator GlxA family with amidase domain